MPSSNKGLVLATLGFHMHNVGDLNAALQNLNRVLQIDPDFRGVSRRCWHSSWWHHRHRQAGRQTEEIDRCDKPVSCCCRDQHSLHHLRMQICSSSNHSCCLSTSTELLTVTVVSHGFKPTSHMKTEKIFRLYLFSSSFFRNIYFRDTV